MLPRQKATLDMDTAQETPLVYPYFRRSARLQTQDTAPEKWTPLERTRHDPLCRSYVYLIFEGVAR